MRTKWEETAMRLRCIGVFAGVMLIATPAVPRAGAQSPTGEQKTAEQKAAERRVKEESTHTFRLINAYQTRDLNDIQTDLRNLFTGARIYGVDSQHAISVQGTPEEIAGMQNVIQELDQPRKMYRLTYTITEMDGGKRMGVERFALVVADGGKAALKQGSRVPIVTGSYDTGKPTQTTEVQYQEVGLNIEAILDGENLRTKVEQTSSAEEKSAVGSQDPILRQTVLNSNTNLTPGKTVVLGSLDVPGSTRHKEIEVAIELVTQS